MMSNYGSNPPSEEELGEVLKWYPFVSYVTPEEISINPENEEKSLDDATRILKKIALFAGPTIGGMILGVIADALKAAAPVPFVVGSFGVLTGVAVSGSYHLGFFDKFKDTENNQVENKNINSSIQDEAEDELENIDNSTRIQMI